MKVEKLQAMPGKPWKKRQGKNRFETKLAATSSSHNTASTAFPDLLIYQLYGYTAEEVADLMFRFGTSSWGGNRKMPNAFTEQGVAIWRISGTGN